MSIDQFDPIFMQTVQLIELNVKNVYVELGLLMTYIHQHLIQLQTTANQLHLIIYMTDQTYQTIYLVFSLCFVVVARLQVVYGDCKQTHPFDEHAFIGIVK